MSTNINCPVCAYQNIAGNSCPNCDTNLSTIRLLQELPQIPTQIPPVKLGVNPLVITLFILLIGVVVGVGISEIFLHLSI